MTVAVADAIMQGRREVRGGGIDAVESVFKEKALGYLDAPLLEFVSR